MLPDPRARISKLLSGNEQGVILPPTHPHIHTHTHTHTQTHTHTHTHTHAHKRLGLRNNQTTPRRLVQKSVFIHLMENFLEIKGSLMQI